MKIENVRVYGIEETGIASGYPMAVDRRTEDEFNGQVGEILQSDRHAHLKRLRKLAKAPTIEGHACALKGVVVQVDITAPQYFWLQFERYHFQDTISSESTMHKVLELDLNSRMNRYVLPDNVRNLQTLVDIYNNFEDVVVMNEILQKNFSNPPVLKGKKDLFQAIVSNIPEGIELTRRITTNYLQLINMYRQRKNHKLAEWREVFCPWVRALPEFEYIFHMEEE